MANFGPRPQPAGLQTIPYHVIEGITDCLGIKDVAKLSATSLVLRQHIRSEWIGFLHHRLARQCKGPRALYFVALLECLCRLEPHLTEYNVSQALDTLRECLASGQCATVSNSVRLATDTRILVAMCQHMDTIDILVDDFASKIFRTNGPILASEVLPPGPENTPQSDQGIEAPCSDRRVTSLSEDEIGRVQEGFLAYQSLCLLFQTKYGCYLESDGHLTLFWVLFGDKLSPLEMERVVSVHSYFINTWQETLCTFRERTIIAGSCGVCGTLTSCRIIQSSLGEYPSAGMGIINHLAHEGILGLERVLEHDGRARFHNSIVSLLPDGGVGYPLIPGPPYSSRVNEAICHYHRDYAKQPQLGRGEEEGQEAKLTKVWKAVKEFMTQRPNSWHAWHPYDPNEHIIQGWTLRDLRSSGWVFVDVDIHEAVQIYRRRDVPAV